MYLVINKCVTAVKVSNFSGHYLRNRSTLDIGVLGYIGIVQHKEHSPEVFHIPPGTPCIYIQGVSRFVDITAGGDFLGLCDQKSSYEHVFDFGRLRSYGHFLIPHTSSCEKHLTEPACGWCTHLGGLSFALQALCASRDWRSSQPSGSLFCGRWWHFRKPALSTDQFKLKVILRS